MLLLPTLKELDAEAARRSLAEFSRQAWPLVEPDTPMLWGWHLDAIAEHLEAVSRSEIQRLIINIPPGHMKSLMVSVFWPAWQWARNASWRALFSSYEQGLALRDSVRTRNIIRSEWFRESFVDTLPEEERWTLSGDQNVKGYFENTRRGFRMALSVDGAGTGYRGHAVVVDDPLNAKQRHSKKAREAAVDWWDKTMSSRLNDQRTGVRVVIMQRLHEQDLTGHLLAKGGWEHLCLPSEYEPERRSTTVIGWSDPRTKPGELLFPELFNPEVLEQAKVDLGSQDYAGQHQQRPSAPEGGIFKRAWWRFYKDPPHGFGWHEVIQSWDLGFKKTEAGSFTTGQVWARRGADLYLIAESRARVGLPGAKEMLRTMTRSYPNAARKLVEDKANGPAIIDEMRSEISGLVAMPKKDSKEECWHAATPPIEAGNVYLPDPSTHPWVEEFIEELAGAGAGGTYNDRADAAAQAINYLKSKDREEGEWASTRR